MLPFKEQEKYFLNAMENRISYVHAYHSNAAWRTINKIRNWSCQSIQLLVNWCLHHKLC